MRYGKWLTEQLRQWRGTPEPLASLLRHEGWQVTLPSEAEWEKAARGSDGRIYPWGNTPEATRANYDDTGINTTSAVGCFPAGASPTGCLDMAGNVWEWTRSLWGEYPYPPEKREQAQRENLDAGRTGARVRRGGSFDYFSEGVRCDVRPWDDPLIRHGGLGFRVVVLPCR